jgi:UDP-3-O-[3-hydroxymyristoyl] glucosamine N-acyltransferase
MAVRLKDILNKIEVVTFEGDESLTVLSVVSMGDPATTPSSLFWCSAKNQAALLKERAGIAIVSQETFDLVCADPGFDRFRLSWIVVNKPRLAFMQILKEFFAKTEPLGRIAASAIINSSARFDSVSVNIGENVVIEDNVVLGTNVRIEHNTVVKSGTRIGSNVKIGCNCTIGGVGFGYELNEEGNYDLIPHIGNVVIENNVEIGNNTCIDRAVLGETHIGENVKIDNLVHIAHGVKIGRNSLIIANAMIAGSAVIGANTWIAPSSSIIQKAHVGDNSTVGMGSVVLKNVEPSSIVAGVPAKKLKDR